jgi:hypothetical protein
MSKQTPITIPGNALVVYNGRTLRLTHPVKSVPSRLPAHLAGLSDREIRDELSRRESGKKEPV